MRRPLRSKRAITSPLRARSKASGLTRIRVRLTAGAPFRSLWTGPLFGGGACGRLVLGRGGGSLFARRRGARAARSFLLRQRGLAVRAEGPARVDRLAAVVAGVLEPPL